MTAITPKKHFREWIEELERAGISPKAVILPAAGLAELITSREPEPVAVLSVGASETHLAVRGSGGELAYARTIRFGGDRIEKQVALATGLTTDEIKAAKKSLRLGPDADYPDGSREQALSLALEKALRTLVSDLSTTFKVLPRHLAPGRLLLTGGLSNLNGLADLIATHLDVPVSYVDVVKSLEKVDVGLPLGAEYGVCAAMLLAYLRRGRGVPLNMRQGEFAYQGEFSLYRGEAIRLGVGLTVLLLLAIGGQVGDYYMAKQIEKDVRDGFCQATKKIVGRKVCSPDAALSIVRQPADTATGLFRPDYSAATLFEMTSRVIGPDLDIGLKEIDIAIEVDRSTPDVIRAKGNAISFDATEQLKQAFSVQPCVRESRIDKQRKQRGSSGFHGYGEDPMRRGDDSRRNAGLLGRE
uniref:SHS2 domain-containing protein n=1 Tax=uncultured marine bacterium MedDCM-OCT-S01-C143 TaxID=743046 RepID=D6PCC7_9BACT|nr:hypothetical protein [uncultured marine bacterium MedDCM-OCT-S01-C143]